jgi:hypothetical protein
MQMAKPMVNLCRLPEAPQSPVKLRVTLMERLREMQTAKMRVLQWLERQTENQTAKRRVLQ